MVAESLVKSMVTAILRKSSFLFFYIHNKKNGHSACNPSKIKGCRAFIKLDKLISILLSTFKKIEYFVKMCQKTIDI